MAGVVLLVIVMVIMAGHIIIQNVKKKVRKTSSKLKQIFK